MRSVCDTARRGVFNNINRILVSSVPIYNILKNTFEHQLAYQCKLSDVPSTSGYISVCLYAPIKRLLVSRINYALMRVLSATAAN